MLGKCGEGESSGELRKKLNSVIPWNYIILHILYHQQIRAVSCLQYKFGS